MKKPIRICMIGAGRVGKNHSRAITRHIAGGKIVALVDPMTQVREETALNLGSKTSSIHLRLHLKKLTLML